MWTIRPKVTEQMRLGLGILALLVAIRAVVDIGHPRAAVNDLILFGPLAALGLVVLGLALNNSRLVINNETVTKVDGLGRAHTWPRSEVARIDRFCTTYHATIRYVVFVGASGRALFKLTGGIWDLDSVVNACRHAHIQLTGKFTDVESPLSLNRRVPGVETWRERLVAILVVAAIVVLAAIATFR